MRYNYWAVKIHASLTNIYETDKVGK